MKLCLDQGEERAKRIVTMRYEDYLAAKPWQFDEGEAAQEADEWAEYASMDELARARDALAWRAVVVACRTGRGILDYAMDLGLELSESWPDWLVEIG